LEEPVLTTIWRDVRRVLVKLFHVLIPRTFSRDSKGVDALRDWDLWGPLLWVLLLSVFLYIGVAQKFETDTNLQSAVFAASFVIVWVGAGIITLNAFLLGGTLGFFQSVCILGYCVFPLMLAAFISLFLKEQSQLVVRIVVVIVCIIWAIIASIGFFAGVVPEGRKFLAMYPVVLFYVVLGWMIVLGTNGTDGTN